MEVFGLEAIDKFQYVEQFMNIMKPRAAALGFLFGALEAAEGSVRLLVAFVRFSLHNIH